MHIAIRTSQLALLPEHRALIGRRAGLAFSRLRTAVTRVDMSLSDVNGPRGGVDKRCRVLVHLEGGAGVFVQDDDSQLASLIDRAIERAGRAAHRRQELALVGRRTPRHPRGW